MIVLVALPFMPGNGFLNRFLVAVLVIVFGFIFVTVSSRIVGLIGSSSNPISGMTIATLMATAMVFVGVGWTGSAYEPMALVVGGLPFGADYRTLRGAILVTVASGILLFAIDLARDLAQHWTAVVRYSLHANESTGGEATIRSALLNWLP